MSNVPPRPLPERTPEPHLASSVDLHQNEDEPASTGKLLRRTSAACILGAVVAVVLVRVVGEAWWPVLLLLYMPRGLLLVPPIVLIAAAGALRRPRLLALNVCCLTIVAGPFMGFNVPFNLWSTSTTARGLEVRILTFNRGMHGIDARAFMDFIDREQIDVICLQEGGGDPVLREYWKHGWYRTDFIASRWPITSVEEPLRSQKPSDRPPDPAWGSRCEIARIKPPGGPAFAVGSVHLDTVRRGLHLLRGGEVEGLRAHTAWRGREVRRLAAALEARSGLPTLVGGDFNLPPESRLLDPLRVRFCSAFEGASWGYGYTCPEPWPWARIDGVFVDPAWTVTRARVAPAFGSDHRGLLATVRLTR